MGNEEENYCRNQCLNLWSRSTDPFSCDAKIERVVRCCEWSEFPSGWRVAEKWSSSKCTLFLLYCNSADFSVVIKECSAVCNTCFFSPKVTQLTSPQVCSKLLLGESIFLKLFFLECELWVWNLYMNLTSKNQWTALHFAVWNNDFECVRMLIEHGANINQTNVRKLNVHNTFFAHKFAACTLANIVALVNYCKNFEPVCRFHFLLCSTSITIGR